MRKFHDITVGIMKAYPSLFRESDGGYKLEAVVREYLDKPIQKDDGYCKRLKSCEEVVLEMVYPEILFYAKEIINESEETESNTFYLLQEYAKSKKINVNKRILYKAIEVVMINKRNGYL